jgi:hypothetical protein
LPYPVYLCLGNHDLTTPDAADRWLSLAPQFFRNDSPSYTIESDDCMIHVVPNHWDDNSFHWKDDQRPHLEPEQFDFLTAGLNTKPELPHIILTHNSVFGLPTEQTGMAEPFHIPPPEFTHEISSFAAKHANVTCVLGAHNHLNMRVNHGGIQYVTVSSLVETPFEFKLFEVTSAGMEMSTVSLNSLMDIDGEYDPAKAFVQGRPADRGFSKLR